MGAKKKAAKPSTVTSGEAADEAMFVEGEFTNSLLESLEMSLTSTDSQSDDCRPCKFQDEKLLVTSEKLESPGCSPVESHPDSPSFSSSINTPQHSPPPSGIETPPTCETLRGPRNNGSSRSSPMAR